MSYTRAAQVAEQIGLGDAGPGLPSVLPDQMHGFSWLRQLLHDVPGSCVHSFGLDRLRSRLQLAHMQQHEELEGTD